MEEINQLAPIALFVYNRPEHTKKTLETLKQNVLSESSRLFIFADGPKEGCRQEQIERIAKVREIIRSDRWCGEVNIYESPVNRGLGESVRAGVTQILSQFGKIIVLEDDLLTSKGFLSYMNKALDFYQKYPAVFSIGGYTYPKEKMRIPEDYPFDTYVCLRNCSWGWATWKDRWDKIEWGVPTYDYIKTHPACLEALNRMGDDEFDILYDNKEKGLNIWSIQFTIAHFVNHAVAIYPCQSYVNNLGLDGSGENCGVQDSLRHTQLNDKLSPRFADILYEDRQIINAFYNVNCRKKRPIWQKAVNFCARKIGKEAPFTIKKPVYY